MSDQSAIRDELARVIRDANEADLNVPEGVRPLLNHEDYYPEADAVIAYLEREVRYNDDGWAGVSYIDGKPTFVDMPPSKTVRLVSRSWREA